MAQTVTPLPAIGDVVPGRDVAGRELRISGHPESDRVVLSIWQDGRCQATVRLARTDVPEVTRALVAGLVPLPAPEQPTASREPRTGTVHQFRPGQTQTIEPAPWASVSAWCRATTDRVSAAAATRLRNLLSRD